MFYRAWCTLCTFFPNLFAIHNLCMMQQHSIVKLCICLYIFQMRHLLVYFCYFIPYFEETKENFSVFIFIHATHVFIHLYISLYSHVFFGLKHSCLFNYSLYWTNQSFHFSCYPSHDLLYFLLYTHVCCKARKCHIATSYIFFSEKRK